MSWRPRKLRTQLVLLILGALLAAQAVSLWLFFDERGLAVRAALGLEAAGRAANVALLLEEAPEDLHPSILRAADSPARPVRRRPGAARRPRSWRRPGDRGARSGSARRRFG